MYSSRAGAKLEHALMEFKIDVTGKVCADLGCSTGGFTDCLLQHGAAKVYAVDTGYGVLDYKLRQNPKVVVMERTNALHLTLPEKVDLVTIDVGWTPQKLILPVAKNLIKLGGIIISLIKPHYEAHKAHLTPAESEAVIKTVLIDLGDLGDLSDLSANCIVSPILGQKAQNTEYLLVLY